MYVFLTLRFINKHQAAQHMCEGHSEEGRVSVVITSQELQQEHEDGCQSRRRGVASELQEVVPIDVCKSLYDPQVHMFECLFCHFCLSLCIICSIQLSHS